MAADPSFNSPSTAERVRAIRSKFEGKTDEEILVILDDRLANRNRTMSIVRRRVAQLSPVASTLHNELILLRRLLGD